MAFTLIEEFLRQALVYGRPLSGYTPAPSSSPPPSNGGTPPAPVGGTPPAPAGGTPPAPAGGTQPMIIIHTYDHKIFAKNNNSEYFEWFGGEFIPAYAHDVIKYHLADFPMDGGMPTPPPSGSTTPPPPGWNPEWGRIDSQIDVVRPWDLPFLGKAQIEAGGEVFIVHRVAGRWYLQQAETGTIYSPNVDPDGHIVSIREEWSGILDNPPPPPPPNSEVTPKDIPQFLTMQAADNSVIIVSITYGTAANEMVTASGALIGGGGDDTLIGGNGTDYLVGGTGNNMLHGGGGADLLDGTGGWSVADYHDAITAVTVNLDGSGNSGDQAEGDRYINVNGVSGSHFADSLNGNASDNVMTGDVGNDTISGAAGNDTLYGSDGDDQLVGGAGNDRLAGGGGNNVLEGGAGADTLDGSYGWGVADYRHALGAVTVRLDGSGNVGDEAAGDVYVNIDGVFGSAYGDTLNGNGHGNWIIACEGNDTVSGASGNDTLYGAEGNDNLDGGADNDVLYGGSGYNVLTGGSGRDVFVFDVAGSVNAITDFNAAEDKIQLDHTVFAGIGSIVSVVNGSMANNGGPQIIYHDGDLLYDADGLGGGLAVKFGTLAGVLSLAANNFVVV